MLETIRFPAFDIFPSTESVTLSPIQITESLAVIIASINVTSIESVALHKPCVTVHVYVPIAVTVVVFVIAPLLHKYESYPVGAVNVVEVPQAVTSLPKLIVGLLTITVTLSVQLTPLIVVVQVYVVVEVGETFMVAVVAPVDHKNEFDETPEK